MKMYLSVLKTDFEKYLNKFKKYLKNFDKKYFNIQYKKALKNVFETLPYYYEYISECPVSPVGGVLDF